MTDVNDLINTLSTGEVNDANGVFSTVMQDKITAALDDRKIALAQNMAGIDTTPAEAEQELEVDDEVQGIPDDAEAE